MSSLWQICHITAESISSAEGEAACGEAAAPHAITGAVAPSRVGSPLGLVFFFISEARGCGLGPHAVRNRTNN